MNSPETSRDSPSPRPGIAYLFSRYPVPSQTFCDWEILAHEAAGFPLLIASLNPPPSTFRHDHFSRLQAEVVYPPASGVPKDLPVPAEITEVAEGIQDRYHGRFNPRQRARNATHFGRILKAHGIRHCHVHFANQATLTALMMRPLGLTYSFTAHGQDFTTDLGDDGLLQELAAGAEFVVAVSSSAQTLLQNLCPDSKDKIHRIYNGIDLGRFPAASPAAPGKLQIVSIGRLIEFKGFLPLVDACAALRDSDIDFHCTIVGDGPMKETLQAHIQKLGLGGHVTLAGLQPLDAIRDILSRSHIFALASIVGPYGAMDTLPTVITEAMACRLPVVSTRIAGIPEMVDHDKTGLLVEPGDTTALADALAALAHDPERRRAMGLAGRKKAEATFALESCAGQLRQKLAPYTSSQPLPAILCLNQDTSALQPGELQAAQNKTTLIDLPQDLPEASVLEAEWQASPDARAQVEKLKAQLPPKFQDATFYAAARQAVALARLAKAQGIRVVHAGRSHTALAAWLLARLAGAKLALTIEPDPAAPRPLLRALLPQSHLANLADPALRSEFEDQTKFGDVLGLEPPQHKTVKLGPIKISYRNKNAPFDPQRAIAWIEKLEDLAHD